jgi:hypothetical protein
MNQATSARGSVAVAIVTSLALTFGATIGLVIDGGHILAARRDADAIAFQAARAGAQALDPAQLADGVAAIDPAAARAAVIRVAGEILIADHRTGRVASVTADATHVTVTIQENTDLTVAALFGEHHATVTGTGSVRVAAGVANEDD